MFTTDTPPQGRRKSFKSFTSQLISNNHPLSLPINNLPQPQNQLDSHSQQAYNLPLYMADRPNDQPVSQNPSREPASDTTHQLPSASLILRHTNKINPRLPRPSSIAPISAVPHSYAYGASAQPRTLPPTVADSESLAGRSRTSRARPSHAHPPTSVSPDRPLPEQDQPTVSEPAHIRYARLSQRLQSTASTAHQAPRSMVSKPPPASSSKDTSVNIASAFERARWAARAQNALIPSAEVPEHEPEAEHEPNGSVDSQPQSRKRKKGRRPSDPSYRYRPGDSASSDSPAGEGIADKRARREKKARLALEQQQLQGRASSKGAPRRSTGKRRRPAGQDPDSDELTGSEEDTGPGIASTRGRRVVKDVQSSSDQRRAPSTRRSRSTRSKNVGPDEDTDLSMDAGPGTAPRRSQRQPISRPEPDGGANKPHPAAKFFLADPSSPQQPEEPVQPQGRPQPDEPGTTDSSRLTLGLSTDSYDFAEEERIVQALETQTRQQRALAVDTAAAPTGELRRRGSPAESPQSGQRSRTSDSEEQGRRSDSGMHEIEEVVAASRQTGLPTPRPRTLPVSLPATRATISPISEEVEPDPNEEQEREQGEHEHEQEQDEQVLVPQRVTMGALSAYRLNSLFSRALRPALCSKMAWMSMLGTLLLAILINSFRTGDLRLPSWSWRPHRPTRPVYTPPSGSIDNLDQLVGRLAQLENALGTLAAAQTSAAERAAQTAERARAGLAYELGVLELRLETEVSGRAALEQKLGQKLDDGLARFRDQLESIVTGRKHDVTERDKLTGALEGVSKTLAGLQQAGGMSRAEATGLVEKAVQKRVQEAVEQARREAVREAIGEVGKMKLISETKVGEMLERDLGAFGRGIAKQLEDRVSVVRKELLAHAAASARTGRVTGQLGSGAESGELASMVAVALERFASDETGERDFALLTAGARVLPQLTTETYTVYAQRSGSWLVGLLTGAETKVRGRGPVTALLPGSAVGMCWPFAGSVGQIGILLSRKIVVKAVSIEHVSKNVALDLGSAPREVEVWGVEDGRKLAEGVYNPLTGPRIQRFVVHDDDSRVLRQAVVVKVKSNHGNTSYTCLYRVRVHGLVEAEVEGGTDEGQQIGAIGEDGEEGLGAGHGQVDG